MYDALERSVESLETTVGLLRDSVGTLEKNSKPNVYLTQTMLQSRRVFELMLEYDVQRAKLDLIEEVEPLVTTLQDKLEKSINRMRRELDTLQQTYELNKLRLSKNNSSIGGPGNAEFDVSTDAVIIASSTNEELEELKKLKQLKEALRKRLEEAKK
ncbi:hypothetical protein HG536_0C00460 [Torulaspora globosa]|uniref:DASH complex subunit SPC19 n=1 Tax=Torulaspora globosa TaxID=48254 RepID=A0A7G3ZEE3_9SACH|nr:uncharacterized protein HG536_0C00460 [Torulaspora globosa]QLL31879.1 hypothetical protein HG536_0C00460 [Torulaspora globosa]